MFLLVSEVYEICSFWVLFFPLLFLFLFLELRCLKALFSPKIKNSRTTVVLPRNCYTQVSPFKICKPAVQPHRHLEDRSGQRGKGRLK